MILGGSLSAPLGFVGTQICIGIKGLVAGAST